jgi:hypothetical protein
VTELPAASFKTFPLLSHIVTKLLLRSQSLQVELVCLEHPLSFLAVVSHVVQVVSVFVPVDGSRVQEAALQG